MADWTASMQQTFEYYIVDPITWKDGKQLRTVKTSSINRDSNSETLESATIDVTESISESYIRIYLVTIQNGVTEKHPLGTFLIQTPSSKYDGKIKSVSMDAYSSLMEFKEKQLPIGYFIPKYSNIMQSAYQNFLNYARAPKIAATDSTALQNDFVASTEDTALSFISDLISNAKYKLSIDEYGRILFAPIQDITALQPVWTYNDDNSSILYPDIDMDHDLYGIPNVVEVIYTNGFNQYYKRVSNDDENSPTSTVSRGREIIHRITDPGFIGIPSDREVEEYANRVLKELSTVEYTVTYDHGYCPVRIGDCVRLNYSKANLKNIKAKVISQSIKCEPGCPVSETAVFINKLWR